MNAEGMEVIEVKMPPAAYGKLRQLRETVGIDSDEALVATALTVFAWCCAQAQEGKDVGSADPEALSFTAIDCPAFKTAKEKGKG
jgi:hypothetical protein